MKSLPLKLGIAVALLFAAVIAACLLWNPLRHKWLESQLKSSDKAAREKAAAKLAADGAKSIPHIRRWLWNDDERLMTGALLVLEKMEDKTWELALPDVLELLGKPQSASTDSVIQFLNKKKFSWKAYCPELPDVILSYIKTKMDYGDSISDYAGIANRLYDYKKQSFDNISQVVIPKPVRAMLYYNLFNHSYRKCRTDIVKIFCNADKEWATNYLIKALRTHKDSRVRREIAKALANIKDDQAVDVLRYALGFDDDESTRIWAATALRDIGCASAFGALLQSLENDTSTNVRIMAAMGLGSIGCPEATEPLIRHAKNNEIRQLRHYCIHGLGLAADTRAIQPLVNILQNDSDSGLRNIAVWSLGRIGTPAVVEPLTEALEKNWGNGATRSLVIALCSIGSPRSREILTAVMQNDSIHRETQYLSALALARLEWKHVEPLLLEAHKQGNLGAHMAIAWHKGDEWIKSVLKIPKEKFIERKEHSTHEFCIRRFPMMIEAKWGNTSALENVVDGTAGSRLEFRAFLSDIFSLMPEGFPDYDYDASVAVRRIQLKVIRDWYKNNKADIAWDKENSKYYLQSKQDRK